MKRLFLAAIAASFFATWAHAQSDEAGPFATPAGAVQFEREGHGFVATVDKNVFDRFDAKALTHFDDVGDAGDAVSRMLVQSEGGLVLYDFRRRPPVAERVGTGMTVRRVFWQGDEVVMQGPQGWFRFRQGVLTKLQSMVKVYH
jgi:hypothetical protein